MTVSTESMEGEITRIRLEGRLDIDGAAAIDLRMNVPAGNAKLLLIDLRGVSFIGSMGLRSIVVPAEAVRRRGGKATLFGPVPMVEEVIKAVPELLQSGATSALNSIHPLLDQDLIGTTS